MSAGSRKFKGNSFENVQAGIHSANFGVHAAQKFYSHPQMVFRQAIVRTLVFSFDFQEGHTG